MEKDWKGEWKSIGKGMDKDWEEEWTRIKKRRSEGKQMKRKGKGMETKKQGKEEERERRGKEYIDAEEGNKRTGKKTRKRKHICGLVWGYLLNKWVSLKTARNIPNLASCMHATLCKTISNVDVLHSYSYRSWGPYRNTVFCA